MSQATIEEMLARADACAHDQKWGEAFEVLQEACAIATSDPRVYATLGRYLLQLQYPVDRWLPLFERAARLSSSSPEVQTQLGLAYAVAGKFNQATDTFLQALKVNGYLPVAAHLLALVYAQMSRHKQAKEVLSAAVHASPDDVGACYLLGRYHELQGDLFSARFLYLQVLKKKPEQRDALLSLDRITARERAMGTRQGSTGGDRSRSVTMLVEDRRIDRRVLDEARSLNQAGWDVTVIAGEPPAENPYWDEECYSDLRIIRVDERVMSVPFFDDSFRYSVRWDRFDPVAGGVNSHLHRLLPDKQWQAFFLARRNFYMEAVEHPGAVYVAHDLPQLPVGAMAALYHGSYLIYDSHELFPEQSFVQNSKSMFSSMEHHLAPMADEVIVVNESMVEEMMARYSVHSEVILNCPSFDLTQLPMQRTNRLRESLNIPATKKILLYQGNIVSRIRNLENVIQAMALIRRDDVALVLMGPDNGGIQELIRLARDKNLLGCSVFFHPAVKQSELLGYTASAEAGLIPYTPVDWNTKYCTPNKLYEFIVAELPILANDLPELSRFVSKQGIGMNLPMGRVEDIASAVDTFFAADIAQFRTRLREISSRFVWENHEGPRIVEIYENVLKDPPRIVSGISQGIEVSATG